MLKFSNLVFNIAAEIYVQSSQILYIKLQLTCMSKSSNFVAEGADINVQVLNSIYKSAADTDVQILKFCTDDINVQVLRLCNQNYSWHWY